MADISRKLVSLTNVITPQTSNIMCYLAEKYKNFKKKLTSTTFNISLSFSKMFFFKNKHFSSTKISQISAKFNALKLKKLSALL